VGYIIKPPHDADETQIETHVDHDDLGGFHQISHIQPPWSQRAQNPIYLIEMISRRKSFIQNNTKVVNLGNNLDKRPYKQRGKWKINPATTKYY
jgi:hypothetical protein